jgi:acyl-CoA synthetase (AMP-forming)/AMP-acid ligase II
LQEQAIGRRAERDRGHHLQVAEPVDRGIGPGSRVGLLARNHAGFVECLVAVAATGADLTLLNTGFAAPQLAEVVAAEGLELVLHDDELRGMSGFRLNPNLMFCGQPGSQARERQRWERMLADRERGREDRLPEVVGGAA